MAQVFYPVGRPLDTQGRIEPTQKLVYTRGLWANGTGELLTFYTSSTQNAASKAYYYEVWGSSSLDCNDSQMFSVAYGNIFGSGSISQGGEAGDTATRAIYSQYRLMCLDPGTTTFTLANGETVNDFYVINFNRDKVGDKLDPGNFELNLAQLNGGAYANSVFTGSNVQISSSNAVITLIDDSGDATDSLGYGGIPSPVRNLVSGSLTNGVYNPTAPHYYGLVYADVGTILISATKLNQSSSFNTVTGSNIAGDNAMKLFKSISGSALINSSGFTARAVDIKEQDFYFVRVPNGEANYSNNPTYITGSALKEDAGKLANEKFRYEPVTYITSVGLYNQDKELVAIAKLSQPIQKSFNSELSITVKLEY